MALDMCISPYEVPPFRGDPDDVSAQPFSLLILIAVKRWSVSANSKRVLYVL